MIKNMVNDWAKAIGYSVAIRRLVLRNLGVSTAEHLCHGRYRATPREMLAQVLMEEMAKDGFVLPEKIASGQN